VALAHSIAQQARIVLLAADGLSNNDVSDMVGVTQATVVMCVDEKTSIQAMAVTISPEENF
jgi:predicted transcriptional regulator